VGSVVGEWFDHGTAVSWKRTKKIEETRCFNHLAAVQPAVAADEGKTVTSRSMVNEPGPHGSSDDRKTAARPRQWYYQRAV